MKKNKMMTAAILLITIIIGGGSLLYFTFWAPRTAPITQDLLSDRAQEFITDQSSDGTGLWSQVRLKDSSASSSIKTTEGKIETDCFSFTLPFQVTTPSMEITDARCTWKAKIISPHGLLTISRYVTTQFNEDSGIVLRKKNTDKYLKIPVSVESLDAVLFFRSAEDLTAFAKSGTYMVTISITNMTQPDAVSTELIKNILSTLTVKTTD
jgi:hypothetical protein